MISIVIPCYEMAGKSAEMLEQLLKSIRKQTYIYYEIIVSDDSNNNEVEKLCGKIDYIKYFRNHGTKGACSNLNNAIRQAKGEIIKPMFQDDQFLDVDCLLKFSEISSPWAVCTSEHIGGRGPHVPYENADVYELARGCNTFGSPSAVGWKTNELTFDENLKWLFDVDFYARMVLEYGQPQILDTKVLIREWEGSATNTIASGGVRISELGYVEQKFINHKKC